MFMSIIIKNQVLQINCLILLKKAVIKHHTHWLQNTDINELNLSCPPLFLVPGGTKVI